MTTLADQLPRAQARCREILEHVLQIGRPGVFLAACLRQSLKNAEEAAASGDVVRMLSALKDLNDYKE